MDNAWCAACVFALAMAAIGCTEDSPVGRVDDSGSGCVDCPGHDTRCCAPYVCVASPAAGASACVIGDPPGEDSGTSPTDAGGACFMEGETCLTDFPSCCAGLGCARGPAGTAPVCVVSSLADAGGG